jgi:hypothetical protein
LADPTLPLTTKLVAIIIGHDTRWRGPEKTAQLAGLSRTVVVTAIQALEARNYLLIPTSHKAAVCNRSTMPH